MLPVRWMSRESLVDGLFTPMSDVWSYGVLLYEMITFGSFPFQGLSNSQVLGLVKSGQTLSVPHGIKPQMWVCFMLPSLIFSSYIMKFWIISYLKPQDSVTAFLLEPHSYKASQCRRDSRTSLQQPKTNQPEYWCSLGICTDRKNGFLRNDSKT